MQKFIHDVIRFALDLREVSTSPNGVLAEGVRVLVASARTVGRLEDLRREQPGRRFDAAQMARFHRAMTEARKAASSLGRGFQARLVGVRLVLFRDAENYQVPIHE